MEEARRRGQWQSATAGPDRETRLGHPEGELRSDLYLTGYRGHFVKVRCSYLADQAAACEPERDRRLDALGDTLGR